MSEATQQARAALVHVRVSTSVITTEWLDTEQNQAMVTRQLMEAVEHLINAVEDIEKKMDSSTSSTKT